MSMLTSAFLKLFRCSNNSTYFLPLDVVITGEEAIVHDNGFTSVFSTSKHCHCSILTKSILRAVLVVGDNLLRQRAVLLPQVSQVFFNTYGAVTAELEVENTEVKLSSRWLLHQLHQHTK